MAYQDDNFDADSPRERSGVLGALVSMNRYLLALLIVPAGLLCFWPPFKEQQAARAKLVVLEQQRDAKKEKVDILDQKLGLIRDNPEYLEAMARDRLHLQKDGEVILRFEENVAK